MSEHLPNVLDFGRVFCETCQTYMTIDQFDIYRHRVNVSYQCWQGNKPLHTITMSYVSGPSESSQILPGFSWKPM